MGASGEFNPRRVTPRWARGQRLAQDGVRTRLPTAVDGSVYSGYLRPMSDSTTVRIDRRTHEDLRRLAEERHITVSEAVARGMRLLRQEQMGQQLAGPLADDERAWLDTDLR